MDALTDLFSDLWDTISTWLLEALSSFLGYVCYIVSIAMCRLVNVVYQMFEILAGLETVTYTESLSSGVTVKDDYLINIFFSHSTINNLYWGMALIGMVLAIVFTMWAVIRKAADINGEQKASIPQILGALGKSIVLMLCMNLIISVTLTATNVLLQSVYALFDNPSTSTQESKKTFTGDDYKTMNEIFQTIGAYSMNSSYNSRYNLNSCFNAIRENLIHLRDNGVFDVYYTSEVAVIENGVAKTEQIDTWQSVLQRIVRSANIDQDVKMDVYHEELSEALLEAMDILRYNEENFKPLESYTSTYLGSAGATDIDVIIFLTGTSEAANNSAYNIEGSMTDPVRGPYYTGTRSIYNYSQVKSDFNMSIGGINYILIIFLTIVIFKELIRIMLACVVRMFQMLLLYVTAPTFIAIMPLDGGEKFKQWSQAFIIQNFSIFGTIITMRLLMIFVPIVFSSSLVLFDNFFMNMLCKVLILYGGFVAVGRSSGLITGILANNAGWQAIQAGDVRGEADSMMKSTGLDKVGSAPVEALKMGADATGLSTLAEKISSPFNSDSKLRQSWREDGGIKGHTQAENEKSAKEGKAESVPATENKQGGGESDNGSETTTTDSTDSSNTETKQGEGSNDKGPDTSTTETKQGEGSNDKGPDTSTTETKQGEGSNDKGPDTSTTETKQGEGSNDKGPDTSATETKQGEGESDKGADTSATETKQGEGSSDKGAEGNSDKAPEGNTEVKQGGGEGDKAPDKAPETKPEGSPETKQEGSPETKQEGQDSENKKESSTIKQPPPKRK